MVKQHYHLSSLSRKNALLSVSSFPGPPVTSFFLTFVVDHHDQSGHIILVLVSSWVICLSVFLSIVPSLLQKKGLSVMWRSDERTLCLFRGGGYNSRSLGCLGALRLREPSAPLNPLIEGSVLGGRCASQQSTSYIFAALQA